MKSFVAGASLALLSSLAFGASGSVISGTVKAPDGAGLPGAFVRAHNAQTKITFAVLSDPQGKYRMRDLPAGDYVLRVKAIGYKADPHPGVKVADGQSQSLDFSLQKGMVQWNDLSDYQGRVLMPEGKGKAVLFKFDQCFACHGFQSRMSMQRRDEDGWQRAVDYMRDFEGGM